jgi:hypothetical protein
MAQGKRNRLSAEQRADMWRRWKAGESLHEIGRAFGLGKGFRNELSGFMSNAPQEDIRRSIGQYVRRWSH